MTDYTVTIIVAIVAGGLGALVTGLFNRTPTQVKIAMDMLDGAIARIDQLEGQAYDLEVENQQIIASLDTLNGKILKMEFAFSIVSRQLQSNSIIPLIGIHELDSMSITELKQISKTMKREQRR